MTTAHTLRAIEAQIDELRVSVNKILANAANGGWSSADARDEATRLATLVDSIADATRSERVDREQEGEHLNEVLNAIYAVAALDFTQRATVRGEGPLDALALSINMLAEELDIAQRSLMEAKSAAEAATVAKSRFLAQMSHEIRTPLTALLGFADMLSAPSLSESDRLNYAMIVRRNGEHLLSVINDILDLSKIEAGKLQLEVIDCSLPVILSDLDSLMRVRASENRLAFEVRLETPIPARLNTDPTRLRQVLLNVVGNAIKFTQHGGVKLAVSYDASGGSIRMDVIDTGIGMTEEQISRLFQPFEQADLSMTRRYGGSGLGLAICRGLMKALGGEISVASTPGKGSTFTMTLPVPPRNDVPLIRALGETRREVATASSQQRKMSGRILLAEDGPDNQVLISTILRKYGLTVTIAENGAIAAETAINAWREGTPYDLVLMDMQMPVMDGYDATRKLRAAGYRNPIVALTAHAMGGERERCVGAGCDDYMRKPIDRAELLETLEKYISQPKTERPAPIAGTETAASEPDLVSQFADDPDMAEIVDRFVRSLPERIDELRAEIKAGNRSSLQRLAHQLKGAGGGYGFPAITEAAAALERSVAGGDADAIVASAFERLASVCARARTRVS